LLFLVIRRHPEIRPLIVLVILHSRVEVLIAIGLTVLVVILMRLLIIARCMIGSPIRNPRRQG
jgi:hypothetical protein